MNNVYKNGDLRVWWVPQIPMNSFFVDVESVEMGVKLLQVLSDYDIFQLENNIKPDYSNAGGLDIWVGDAGGGWESWYDEETGEDDPELWLSERLQGSVK